MYMKKRKIILLSVGAVLFGFIMFNVWDIAIDPPAWWRFERQHDKSVILEYVKRNYPDAKKIGGTFPIPKIAEFHKASTMLFELEGIEFSVSAEYGEIVEDTFTKARAISQFDKIIKDGFMKPRGINSAVIYGFMDDYRETYPYTGDLSIELQARGSTPQEVGWLYDFYKYWKKEGAFLSDYHVTIYIYNEKSKTEYVNIKKNSEFADENEFYSAFKKYEFIDS